MRSITLPGGSFAIVDDQDYNELSRYKWRLSRGPDRKYATAHVYGGNSDVYMHRFIMRAPRGTIIDHINGNPLDNRRSNLRFCTTSQNNANRPKKVSSQTGFKGVCFRPKYRKPYIAQITHHKTLHYLGCYETPEEAAKQYDAAAREAFGEFAYTNFPDEPSSPTQATV